MTRERKTRRLVVGGDVFIWSVRHKHLPERSTDRECREVLGIRRDGQRGRLEVVFAAGPGHAAGDGCDSGQVGVVDGVWLNLHLPSVVRAVLDEAVERGWQADDPAAVHVDGWGLIEAVAARLDGRAGEQSAE
ncbi:hypothetical protein GCM10009839_80990 [Catenulispora yoronensis]|uniref:Uncharacterized protein n=1 Tax=Catenulispora yoronensis TaxID=450799 RepID=A0ABN2VHI5_9ACTN